MEKYVSRAPSYEPDAYLDCFIKVLICVTLQVHGLSQVKSSFGITRFALRLDDEDQVVLLVRARALSFGHPHRLLSRITHPVRGLELLCNFVSKCSSSSAGVLLTLEQLDLYESPFCGGSYSRISNLLLRDGEPFGLRCSWYVLLLWAGGGDSRIAIHCEGCVQGGDSNEDRWRV